MVFVVHVVVCRLLHLLEVTVDFRIDSDSVLDLGLQDADRLLHEVAGFAYSVVLRAAEGGWGLVRGCVGLSDLLLLFFLFSLLT